MRLERVYFSTVAVRLSAKLHKPVGIPEVNVLVCGWNNYRARRGKSRINFAQRVKDEVQWQQSHGWAVDKERFFFVDELELFSRYAGYDLTH